MSLRALFVVMLIGSVSAMQSAQPPAAAATEPAAKPSASVSWLTDVAAAEKKAAQTGQPLLLVFR